MSERRVVIRNLAGLDAIAGLTTDVEPPIEFSSLGVNYHLIHIDDHRVHYAALPPPVLPTSWQPFASS